MEFYRTRNAMNKMAVKLGLQTKNPKEGVSNSNQAKFPSLAGPLLWIQAAELGLVASSVTLVTFKWL